jgi:serine/threonine-protein kinase
MNTGELEKAATYTTQALEITREIYGEDNIETISTLLRFAAIRESQERFDEARALADEAATLLRPTLNQGDSRLDLALALVLEGRILLKQNRYLEAEPLLQEVLDIRRDELPEGHWQIASAESLLGDVYTSKGNYQQAEKLLLPSYEMLSQEFPKGDQRNDDALERVIRLYEAWNKPELVRRYQAVKSSEQ